MYFSLDQRAPFKSGVPQKKDPFSIILKSHRPIFFQPSSKFIFLFVSWGPLPYGSFLSPLIVGPTFPTPPTSSSQVIFEKQEQPRKVCQLIFPPIAFFWSLRSEGGISTPVMRFPKLVAFSPLPFLFPFDPQFNFLVYTPSHVTYSLYLFSLLNWPTNFLACRAPTLALLLTRVKERPLAPFSEFSSIHRTSPRFFSLFFKEPPCPDSPCVDWNLRNEDYSGYIVFLLRRSDLYDRP